MRDDSKSVVESLTEEVIASPEMDAVAVGSRKYFFNSRGGISRVEFFKGIIGSDLVNAVPICADGETVKSNFSRSVRGTIHPHPPGPGGEYPGPADTSNLKVGPVYIWTPHGALRVIEARFVNGRIAPVYRTVVGGDAGMNAEAANWSLDMSDDEMIRSEGRFYK